MYPSGWRSLIGIPAIGWSDPGLPPPLLAGSPPWRSRSSWPPSLPPELVCATGPSSSPCSSPDGGQELLDLQGGEPARRGGGSPGSLQPIAGIPINDLHPEGYIYSDSRCHTLIHADSFRGL